MANRYTEISTSQFNPLSFEQIAAPAMMKRGQHDKALADQELMIQGLAKVQPHEKFYTEAQRLKNEIESKIDGYGTKLAQEGVNNNTQSEMIALNREYQNLISPTGKLGMINSHNSALQKTYEDSIAASVKMGNSETVAKQRANEAVQKHMKEPLYNPKTGQVIPFVSSSAPKFVDPVAFTDALASKAKMSSTEWKRATAGLKMNAAGDRFVIDQSKAGATGTNRAQLQSAADLINLTLNDPQSELRQSLDYNYKDINQVKNQLAKQLGIYVQDEQKSSSDFGISNMDWYTAPKGNGTDTGTEVSGVTQTTETVQPESTNNLNDLNRIGTNATNTGTVGSPLTMGVGGGGSGTKPKSSKWTHQDIADPILKKQYVNTWNAFRTKGIFPTGSHADDPEVAKIISQKIKENGPVTVSTKALIPDVSPNAYMFAGKQKAKDRNERSNVIGSNLTTGRQKMQDPEDPSRVLTAKEFNERGYKVQYDSYLSPMNFSKNPFGNSAQGAVPHQVIVTKDGKRIGTSLVSRTEEDIRSPEGRASQEIHNVFDTTVSSPNMEHSFSNPRLKAQGIKNLKVEYITRNNGQPLETPLLKVKINGQELEPMTEEQFTKNMYDHFTTK